MSQSTINNNEQDLLTLTQPFRITEGDDKTLKDEALTLLAFVEKIVGSGDSDSISPEVWHDYLNISGRPKFLTALDSLEARYHWADLMFAIVDSSKFTLQTMFEQRVEEHPDRHLFREADKGPSLWSYEQVLPDEEGCRRVLFSG